MKEVASKKHVRYFLTDTGIRSNDQIRADIDKHTAAFMAKGGKITQVASSVSALNPLGINPQAFVINQKHHKERQEEKKSKQKWKENKT